MGIPDYTVVRVVRLSSGRDHRVMEECSRPRIGDEGTVVDRTPSGAYVVEKVLADGRTAWLADFAEDDLEVVERR